MGIFKDQFIESLKPSKDPSKGSSISDGLLVIGHGLTQIWPISPIVQAIRKGLGASRLFTEPDALEPTLLDSEPNSSKFINLFLKGLLYDYPKQILGEFRDFYRSGQWLEGPIYFIASLTFIPAVIIAMIAFSYFLAVSIMLPIGVMTSIVEAAFTITRGAIQLVAGTLASSVLGIFALAEVIVNDVIGAVIEKSIIIAPKIIPAIKNGAKNLWGNTKGFFSKVGKIGSNVADSTKNLLKPKPTLVKEQPLEGITVTPTEKTPLLPPKTTNTLAEKISQFDLDFPKPPTEPPEAPPPAYSAELPNEEPDDEAPAPAYKGRTAIPE